ncbi:MAG: carbon-nitrogen hydrolase family protein, partial [Rhodothermales bacterium]
VNVTVCQLNDEPDALMRDWEALVVHVQSENSDLVLLPEMPFFSWIAREDTVDPATWQASVEAHDTWIARLDELAPACVLGSRPVTKAGRRLNEGFIWDPAGGYRAVHAKYYLPEEAGFREASWYERGRFDFTSAPCNRTKVGFLICTEMWFTEHARTYAKAGIHILASPRATGMASVDKWIAGGRAAAVMSGAYCLSSNRGGIDQHGFEWAGSGWIIEPEEGDVLAFTSQEHPFVTLDIDLTIAEHAKRTYPRYVPE